MGGLTQQLFGGSSQKSSSTQESGNKAYDYLMGALGGNVQTGNNAMSSMAGLLGIGGDPAAGQKAFDQYKDSTGYNFMMDSGQRAITGSAAAKGLLNSGSTAKALTQFGQNLGTQTFGNYLGQLQQLFANGMQGAGMIGNAGAYSKGTSTSKGSSNGGIIPGLFG